MNGAAPTLAPMMCGSAAAPPDLEGWVCEPKWDGVRTVLAIDASGLVAKSRNGNDVTAAYPELAGLAAIGGRRSLVLDSEVITLDAGGRPSFERLQRRMHVRRPSQELVTSVPVHIICFDVLWIDGEDLCALPLTERRTRLEELAAQEAAIELCPRLPDGCTPDELLDACRASGMEGFVAKRVESPYLPGKRSPAWTKVKAVRRREVVVGGWQEGEHGRAGRIGSLAIGWVDPDHAAAWPDGACLRWAGQVGSGFTDLLLDQVGAVMTRYARDDPPFLDAPRGAKIHWVDPVLVVEVQFTEVTTAGTLRHPVLKGTRPDLDAAQVGPGEGLGP
jgi:bifunctional non-homologous end joining protein LigD